MTSNSETTLALSDLHRRRDHLEQEKQWLLKQITRKQKELANFVQQMRDIATEIFQGSRPYVEKIAQLSQEVHQFFEEIFSKRKMGKKTRYKISQLYETLQDSGLLFPSDEEDEDEELDELFEDDETEEEDFFNDFRDRTESFFSSSEEQESKFDKKEDIRHIRQTFLRLAEVFHPDKVTDEETKTRHTEIMKELNRAYREQDFAKLLELEKQHLEGETIDNDQEDELTRHCRLLEKETQVLRQQYDALLDELKLVRRSPEGAMVTDYRRAKREKIDPIAIALKELEQQEELLTEIHQFVKDFKDKKITIQTFLAGPPSLAKRQQEYMEELMVEMLEHLDDLGIEIKY
ncbi:MAG: molecular chaperone DnaJ [Microcystaceae cyanobacterium]